jgi:hypothetical protein
MLISTQKSPSGSHANGHDKIFCTVHINLPCLSQSIAQIRRGFCVLFVCLCFFLVCVVVFCCLLLFFRYLHIPALLDLHDGASITNLKGRM